MNRLQFYPVEVRNLTSFSEHLTAEVEAAIPPIRGTRTQRCVLRPTVSAPCQRNPAAARRV